MKAVATKRTYCTINWHKSTFCFYKLCLKVKTVLNVINFVIINEHKKTENR